MRKTVANLFGKSALPALVVGALMLLSPVGAMAQRGGGRSAGGGFRGGGVVGGGFRGGAVGGYGGGYYGGFRGGYYGGGWGLGGLGFGYPYYGYGYPYYGGYGYDPYANGYNPYSYGGYDSNPAPPVNTPQYGYPQGQPYPQGQYPQSQAYPQQQPYPQGQYPGQAYPQQQPYPPQYRQRYPPQTQPQQPQIQPQSAPAPNQGQGFYLIAFSDHTIQAATAYKVDGDQIHWIGRDGAEKQAPLSTVDVRFSKQINRDRQVDFQIP